jgi:SAM-dependent methyltransferase
VDLAMELVDRLAGEVVLRHAGGRVALDLGHGAPRVTEWVRPRAGALKVVDALDLGRGAEIRLPFADASFELVYSLRTLPHLGHDEPSSTAAAAAILLEIARVLAPGGTALCQIDNPRSLFGLYHGIRHPITAIERGALVVESERGVTRFDTLPAFLRLVPASLAMTDLHGLRVFTALPRLLALPILGRLLFRLEWLARDRAPLRAFGAHLIVVLRRVSS